MCKVKHGREVYEAATKLLDYDPETGLFKWKKRFKGVRADLTAGRVSARGYHEIRANRKLLRSHRLAWYMTHQQVPDQIDHINGDRTDNRITNLRNCTHTQNCRNCKIRKNNTSKCVGVHWDKNNRKWQASIKVNYVSIHLGRFDDIEDAKQARIEAENKYYGEFAPSNRTEGKQP